MSSKKTLISFLLFYFILVSITFGISSIGPDEGTYLLLGLFYKDLVKYILNHGFSGIYDFAIDYLVHYPKLSIYYPPLYQGMIAMIFFFFVSEHVGRLITLAFSLGVLVLTYKIGEFLFSKRVGLISSIFLGFTPIFFTLSREILMDVPLFFFFMLSIWLGLTAFETKKKKYFIFLGFSLTLGFLTKWSSVLSIPILLLYQIFQRSKINEKIFALKWFFLSFLLFLVLISPYLLFALKFGILRLAYEGAFLAGLREKDPQWYTIEGWVYYPKIFFSQVSAPLASVSIATMIYFFLRRERNWNLMFVWILVVYVFFTFSVNKDQRYTILYLPPIFFMASHLFEKIISKSKLVMFILLAILVFSELVFAYVALPKTKAKIEEISKYVIDKSKGNIAFVSESGDYYTSSFMFYFDKHDINKSRVIYRPCVFDNKTEDEIYDFLVDTGVEYVIVVRNGWDYENFDRVKNLIIEKEVDDVGIYRFADFKRTVSKKCNYICLTQETICSPYE